jgi:uncharacterized protein YdhG (YjbR/CyaY superfamily)
MKKASSDKMVAPAVTVDRYLAELPDDVRAVLEKLRRTIKSAAPKGEEGISYGMPVYKYKGALVYFGAFTNHCSFFIASKAVAAAFEGDLKDFHTSGVTVHFSADHPMPSTLVKKIVRARIAENEARAKN